ncbi:MAG: hypothetical protein ACI30H_02635 [Paludibacteraceae bacterium]
MTTKKNPIIGAFGEQFTQFKHKPKDAIKYLKKVKRGECIAALYRPDIGDIDIVWGTPGLNGYGLSHIISEHGAEIKQLGFEIEDFIVLVFTFGKKIQYKNQTRIFLDGETYRIVIETRWYNTNKNLIVTAFDLRPIQKKNPKRMKELNTKKRLR